MFVPKKDRIAIYSYLFKEGVLVAKKDVFAKKHTEIEVPNLYVMKLLQSLKSRGLVEERFAWQYFYWTLNNKGIEFLREYLHLPSEIVPATLKKQARPAAPRAFGGDAPRGGRGRGGRMGDRAGREGYRGPKKDVDGAPRNFRPEFESSRGRGGFSSRGRGGASRGRGGAVSSE